MKKILMAILVLFSLFVATIPTKAYNELYTPSGISFSDVEEFIDQYVEKHLGLTTPGAAVVLVKNGQILFSKGYGLADVENEIYVDSSKTVFEYGSISKLFVYTTIMRLVEQGKIDLNQDIRSYLPAQFLKNIKYDVPITMLDIMNHTTGFEDYLFDVILTRTNDLPTFEQTLEEAQPNQVYEPSTVVAYSNYAVALAAYVAERIIGQTYHAYLKETIFDPLAMDNTSAHPMLKDRRNLLELKAKGYSVDEKTGFKQGAWSYVPLYPIGGVNGTAEDLARFAMTLLPDENSSSQLFNNVETLPTMLEQTFKMGPEQRGFAHGFIEQEGEPRALGHGGNTAYFSSQMMIVPEERFGVIVLTNAANEMNLTSGLIEALIGSQLEIEPEPQNTLPETQQVEGTYISARRMHTGFLEVYAYLSLMTVRTVTSNTIELNMLGQTSTMIQTKPYFFERINANGAIFENNFKSIYFEIEDGEVKRITGDFLPLPSMRTLSWLYIGIFIILVTTCCLLLHLLIFVASLIFRRSRKNKLWFRIDKVSQMIVMFGFVLWLNNAIIILRMLVNNYRSFSEFYLQIVLNYPLALLICLLSVYSLVNFKKTNPSIFQKLYKLMLVLIFGLFLGLLINWQFFKFL